MPEACSGGMGAALLYLRVLATLR